MVKYISVLPPEIRQRRKQKQQQQLFLLVGAILLSILLISYSILFGLTFLSNMHLKALQTEKQELQAQVDSLNQYGAIQERIDFLKVLVEKAVGSNPEWGEILTQLGVSIPNGVWLTDFSSVYTEGKGALTLRGWAYNHPLVAEFLEKLQQSPELQGVQCQFSTLAELNGQPAVQFEIKAGVQPGQSTTASIASEEGGN